MGSMWSKTKAPKKMSTDTNETSDEEPMPELDPILTETEDSTPENRRYSLDPFALLAHVRRGLVLKYKRECAGSRSPLPWKENLGLSMPDEYVPLIIEQLDRSGQVPRRVLPSIGHLFHPLDTEGSTFVPRHILMRGEAGAGKTTFARYVTYCWANNIPIFDKLDLKSVILVYYPLKNLKDDEDIQEELLKICHAQTGLHPSLIEHTSQCLMRHCKENLMVIFDGYDELSSERMDHVRAILQVNSEAKFGPFRMSIHIVISRFETDRELLYLFDRQFRFRGFEEENLKKFISMHSQTEASATIDKLRKHRVFRRIQLVGLAPVTILLMLDLMEESVEFHGDLYFVWKLIMLFAERSRAVDNHSVADNELEEQLCHFGEFLYMCFLVKAKDFEWKEMKNYLQDTLYIVKRCGLLRRKMNPPMGRSGNIVPQEMLYGKCLQSFFIRNRWLSLSSDHERKRFLNTMKIDVEAPISVLIYRLSDNESRVCVRLLGNALSICFDWKVANGEAEKMRVTLEPFNEYKTQNECFRMNIGFSKSNVRDIEMLLGTVRNGFISRGECEVIMNDVMALLKNTNRKNFVLSIYDNTAREEEVSKENSNKLSHSPKHRKINVDLSISFRSLQLTSSLLKSSKHFQVAILGHWAAPIHLNHILNVAFEIDTKNNDSDEYLPEYLTNLGKEIEKCDVQVKIIFKFRGDSNILLNYETGKVTVCDNVYCSIKKSLNFREISCNRDAFVASFKWNMCYKIIVTAKNNYSTDC